MKILYFTVTSIFIKAFAAVFCLAVCFSCRSFHESVVKDSQNVSEDSRPSVREVPAVEPEVPPLVEYIRQTAPRIPQGTTRAKVDSALQLNTRFNGIVFSGGDPECFTYYYQLKGWELRLHFDYQKSVHGAFLHWELDERI